MVDDGPVRHEMLEIWVSGGSEATGVEGAAGGAGFACSFACLLPEWGMKDGKSTNWAAGATEQ